MDTDQKELVGHVARTSPRLVGDGWMKGTASSVAHGLCQPISVRQCSSAVPSCPELGRGARAAPVAICEGRIAIVGLNPSGARGRLARKSTTTIRPSINRTRDSIAPNSPEFSTIRPTPHKTAPNLYSHNSANNATTIRPVTVTVLLRQRPLPRRRSAFVPARWFRHLAHRSTKEVSVHHYS
jgi:hypothetical protein